MKRFYLILISLLVCSISLNAQQRSESEAMQIAKEFMENKGIKTHLSVVPHQKLEAGIRKRKPAQRATSTSQGFYIVNDEDNNCFVIVSADERMYDVLGYSNNGSFSIDEVPDGLLFILDKYNRQYEIVKELEGSVTETSKETKNVKPINPLLSTKWGQGNPYWLQCPQYSDAYCVSGCVATAMAQVMAYHKYPENGQGGSLSYTTGKLGIFQYMNFNSQHFDWNKIQDTYIGYYDENGEIHRVPERSEDEDNAVAKLIHACGVSVFMDYDNGISGAYPFDIPYALIHYFGYNPNIYFADKDYYTSSDWNNLILTELNAKRPILYGGSGSLGGHRFVLDGVDSNGRYHFNFGWSGHNDGYFELDALSPSVYNFSSDQSMILLVTKDVVGSPADVFYSNSFSLSNSVVVGTTTKAKFNPECYSNRTNSQKVKFDGKYGIGVFDKDWNFIKSIYSSSCNLNAGYSYRYSQNVDVKFDETTFTENSSYYIALYAQSSNAEKPTPMRTAMGANDWYRATTKDGVVSLELLGIISDNPSVEPEPETPKPLPLTGELKVLSLDQAGEYKIWDVSVIKDGTDSKKYWFKAFDPKVSERGYTAENNHNTVFGVYDDDGQLTIPVPQQVGENLFINNYSSDNGLNVVIAQDGGMMKINDTWGTVEKKETNNGTTQEKESVYTSTTYYPKAPVPVETPVIVVDENHKMTIACGTEGAAIYYTLDGNTPTTSSKKYSGTIDIDRNLTVKALAVTLDNANTSDVAQLTVNDFVVSIPTFTEIDGEISIKSTDADKIYFTTDGTKPVAENGKVIGEEYTKPLKFDSFTTIKAVGIHDGWKNSDIATYDYIVTPTTVEIEVLNNKPGELGSRIPSDSKLTAKSLTITGELNGTDIAVIREMLVDGKLEYLNIKGCSIKSGGDKYPYLLSMSNATEDNIIGKYMFSESKNLKVIVLPDNVVKIEDSAFYECDQLKSVSIPEGCKEIEQVFKFCDNLESVNLPNSLEKFEESNFAYCPKLSAIQVADGNKIYKSINGNVYSKDGKTLIRFANGNCSDYNILEGTTIIGKYAFYCSKIEDISIPSSVVSIEDGAFYASENLKEVVLPNSILNLGENAFYMCSNLTSIILSPQISSIKSGCFTFCSSLQSIYFPQNIKEIYDNAFNYCSLLKKFEVDESNPYFCSDDGVVYTKDKRTLVRCPVAFYSEVFPIQDGIENIGDNAFMGCSNIEKFTLPLSVDSIGQHAFEGCSVSNILLSENVKFVGYQAFSSCDSLKTFVLPTSLKEIGQSLFIFDYALSYVKIHGDVTKIGNSSFRFCHNLSAIECNIKDIENVEVGDLTFDGIPDDCTWYIPFGTEDKYKACSWWVPTWRIVSLRENSLVAPNINLSPGETALLPIELYNDDVIRMVQFELRLPEGLSVQYDDENERYAVELTNRATNQHILQCSKLSNGNYRFELSTSTANNINGNNGVLANITVKAEDNINNGKYEAYLANNELTVVEDNNLIKVVRPNDYPLVVHVIANGDVNVDGRVDISDIVAVINLIAEGSFTQKADVNKDWKVDISDIVAIINIIASGKGY